MPSPLTPSPDLALVHEDEFCAQCGYNLKTLSTAGICPECGAAVAPSLGKKPFRGAPRRWLITVAAGLALLILAFLLTAAEVLVASEPHDKHAVLFTLAPAGARLWITTRFLQMHLETGARIVGLLLLLVHLAAIFAITRPIVPHHRAERALRISLRVLAGLAPIFWIFYAWEWRPFSPSSNDTHEFGIICTTFYDLAVVIITGLVIAAVALRGGYRKSAIAITLLMATQSAGMASLFFGVYLNDYFHFVSEDALIWPNLIAYATAGVFMTCVIVFLIRKLWVAAKQA